MIIFCRFPVKMFIFPIDFNGNCLNIVPGRSGMPPDHSQTLLGDVWKKYFSIQMPIFLEPLFLQKSTSYGSSGESTFFQVFTPPCSKHSTLPQDFCIWSPFSEKALFSFRAFPELIPHRYIGSILIYIYIYIYMKNDF